MELRSRGECCIGVQCSNLLRIRGLAIADDVQIDLHEGFNVLTGETGAGKSIVIDALSLVRGGRGRSALVREGCDALRVEAQFRWSDGGVGRSRRGARCRRPDTTARGGRCSRRLTRGAGDGSGALPASRRAGVILGAATGGGANPDICGQHEHHGLTRVERHREVVDAQASVGALLASYASEYRRWRTAAEEVESLEATRSEARRACPL